MTIPIVTYHTLGDQSAPISTSRRMFEAQLDAFVRCDYHSLTLSSAIDYLRRGEALPEKTVVFTFDDGYESVFRWAWPCLRARGFTATIFLITDYCGRDNRWPGQPESVNTESLLTWDQVWELAAEGCDFGAHTRTHPVLPELPITEATQQILDSQQRIAAEIGQPIRTFSYPYGATNQAVTEVVRRQFSGAVGTELGLVQVGDDPYLLARVDAHYLHPTFIPFLPSAVFARYLRLRQGLRATRRRLRPDWEQSALVEGPIYG